MRTLIRCFKLVGFVTSCAAIVHGIGGRLLARCLRRERVVTAERHQFRAISALHADGLWKAIANMRVNDIRVVGHGCPVDVQQVSELSAVKASQLVANTSVQHFDDSRVFARKHRKNVFYSVEVAIS